MTLTDAAPTSSHPEETADLVRRILDRQPEAEAELVERFSRGVRFLLLQLTRDAARADDLHQETFLLTVQKVRAGELREPDKLAGFIRQTARNLFIAEYRQNAKNPKIHADQAPEPPDPAASPLSTLISRENADIVRQLLAELEPPRDREILFRFFIAEHSKEDICSDFALSSLHFNRVLHRARQRLKDLVTRYYKRQNLPGAQGAVSGGSR